MLLNPISRWKYSFEVEISSEIEASVEQGKSSVSQKADLEIVENFEL